MTNTKLTPTMHRALVYYGARRDGVENAGRYPNVSTTVALMKRGLVKYNPDNDGYEVHEITEDGVDLLESLED
jgi:hypothetical protein